MKIEERKKIEAEYYDQRVKSRRGDFEGFEPQVLASFKFLYKLLPYFCRNKIVLDYGCGNGIHLPYLIKAGAKKIIAIDLSEKSLEIAREKIKKEGLGDKVEFLKMDCEKMDFPDNSFDLVFDGGTFSSLDLKRVYPELVRILKPEGFLIGIETFGHNPFTNLKRKLNKITKKRTAWATEHIFKMENIKAAKNYFGGAEVYFFHIISWLAFPFLRFPGGQIILRLMEAIDRILLLLPFLRKYAFKVVFIFSVPRK